ncbi:hypothetical protein [Bradyrhizobium brasilense]|uniref:Glycosyltransferase family 1 protein n=1 Tax=Bradyrhizobium brasilense TaxID=1419277 RepID=A0ABY8JPY8_9BRAD|nr:hypothetical protein [Bradyrhizobium brasilense]WFU66904.1 hypothetical protein QA636_16025 [Bradyrhizobium brasilense]
MHPVSDLSRRAVEAPASGRSLQLLLLCDFVGGSASTIIDHAMSLRKSSRHAIQIFNSKGDLSDALEFDRFDGVLIHYSLVACMDDYIGPNLRAAISRFKGLKAAFVQDEYRWTNETTDALRALGIHVLFSVVPPEIIDEVYPQERLPGVVRETLLTGYVPAELLGRAVQRYEERSVDVGYRARKLPAWLGSFAREKWLIADRFKADAAAYGLVCDMSTREEDRLYGESWIEFLASCKAVLGTESGSSVCDFTGDIQRNVEQHLARDPTVSYETLRDLYFKDTDGRIILSVISPRCFEAAALRTLMILYDGHYSGRLEAWRHYVPLRKDHSNMSEVVEVLRDRARAEEIIDRVYREVALNPDNSFEAMVAQVDRVIDRAFRPEMAAAKSPYVDAELTALMLKERRRATIRKALQHLDRGRRRPIETAWVVVVRAFGVLARLVRTPLRRRTKQKIS